MAATQASQLETLQKTVDDMRALVHCQICLKPFYEPYTLACGHTYCYSCLTSWCTGTHNRGKIRNCPDCRAPIAVQPSPNYVVRDMVQKFLSRAELLPEDETVQEHDKAREQEAKVVAADRSGRGLFKGLFRPTGFRFAHHHRPAILDHEDGVDRCPQCTWELEEGICLHCGWSVSDDDTGDSIDMGSVDLDNSDDENPDFSDVDEFDEFGDQVNVPLYAQPPPHRPLSLYDRHRTEGPAYPAGSVSPRYSSDDDDEEDEEDDGEMDSFIENDEDLPNEVDDDDASVETVQGNRVVSGLPTQSAPPAPGQFQFYGLDTEDEDSADESLIVTGNDMAETTTNDEGSSGDESDGSSSASSEPSVQEIPPPQPHGRPTRKRRILVDSEDEESSEIESEANGFSSLDEESDDTAIRPPQARGARQRRLRQRARTSSNSPHTPPERLRVAEPQRVRADRTLGSLRGSGHNVMHTARRGGRVSTRVH